MDESACLWAAMFIVAIVLFRPLEQTVSRSIADRRVRDEGSARSCGRSPARVAASSSVCVVTAAAWGPLSRLFGGNGTLMALLLAGITLLWPRIWFADLAVGICGSMAMESTSLPTEWDVLRSALPLFFIASQTIAASPWWAPGLRPHWLRSSVGGAGFDPSGPCQGEPFRREGPRFAAPAAPSQLRPTPSQWRTPLVMLVVVPGAARPQVSCLRRRCSSAHPSTFTKVSQRRAPQPHQLNAMTASNSSGGSSHGPRGSCSQRSAVVSSVPRGSPRDADPVRHEYRGPAHVFAALGVGSASISSQLRSRRRSRARRGSRAAAVWVLAASRSYCVRGSPGAAPDRVAMGSLRSTGSPTGTRARVYRDAGAKR